MDLSHIKDENWDRWVQKAIAAGFVSRISVTPGLLVWSLSDDHIYRIRFLVGKYLVNIQAQKTISSVESHTYAAKDFSLKEVPDVFSLRCKGIITKQERKIYIELYEKLITFFQDAPEVSDLVTGYDRSMEEDVKDIIKKDLSILYYA